VTSRRRSIWIKPEGFQEVGKEDLVCRLKKSLYGLKQAPRAWNIKLHEELSKLGFTRLEADHSVYARGSSNGQTYLLVYVDDMLIVGSCHEVVKEMKEDLSKVFTMTDLGEASYFLGLEFSGIGEQGGSTFIKEATLPRCWRSTGWLTAALFAHHSQVA